MSAPLMVYGAYGYTGRLMVRYAQQRGWKPVLAGRNRAALASMAEECHLEHRAFDLENPEKVAEALAGIPVVIHAAGPFIRTAEAMAEGCLIAGTHYLDITGEIEVFERLARLNTRARQAGVMILPGAGFDVVPSDCLAAHLKQKLPTATRLEMGFFSKGRPSHGTALTILENMTRGGMVRKNGVLTPVPAAWRKQEIDLGEGICTMITIPWGDVSTAFYSTGIPDIEIYMAAPKPVRMASRATRYLGFLLDTWPIRSYLRSRIKEGGPSDAERARGYSLLWGRVHDSEGRTQEARLRTPDGYTLTAWTSLLIAAKVLDGNAPAGFQTPSLAYGPDLIMEIEGVSRS